MVFFAAIILLMYLAAFQTQAIVYASLLLVMIFLFVLVHELAHVVTAHHYGVPTRSITLHPLGGVSMLERVPDRPGQEAMVAFAGPLTNLVFALLLVPVALHLYGAQRLFQFHLLDLEAPVWALDLLWINLILGVFNLMPAFPLDGGRLLRSSLALRIPYARATRIAAFVGRTIAIGFVIFGLFWNLWLVLIGIFIFYGAAMEERSAQLMYLFARMKVHEAMRTDIQTVSPRASLEEVTALRDPATKMPVVVTEHGALVGLIDNDTLRFLQPQRDRHAQSVMRTNLPTLTPEDDLSLALRHFAGGMHETIPIIEAAPDDPSREAAKPPRLLGLLTTQDMEAAYRHLRRQALDERAQKRLRRKGKGGVPQATEVKVRREGAPNDTEQWIPQGPAK